MTVFREISATEKRRELEAKVAQLEQEETREWEIRESIIGKIFGDALRSGKLSGAEFLGILTPLVSRKGDWKKLGVDSVPEPTAQPVVSKNVEDRDSAGTNVGTIPE